MTKTRTESDSIGDIDVPADKYWGAQTQRSKQNFPIGDQRELMPIELIRAFGIQKEAAARANMRWAYWTKSSAPRLHRRQAKFLTARWMIIFRW
jgi:fumarate hydratase class II